MDAAVTVSDLVVDRGPRRVLHGLSFAVPQRQVTGLLGPSGSGKTTLMRAIVGVQQVRSGEVTVLGEPAGSAGLRHRVGYVTQAPSVYEDLTVRENARYFASLYGMSAREADAALADVGLTDAAGRCDRLLLLRDGDLIADSTPAQLRADGRSEDLEEAFLNVVRAREEVAA